MFYRFFDSRIDCDRALPELDPLPNSSAIDDASVVRFDAPRSVRPISREQELRPWLDDTDRVLQGRFGDSILIRVRGLADFLAWPQVRSVHCHAHPEAHPASVRHFLLNQILPRLISVRDPLVIHAGAVLTERGAIALAGPAGTGKSTLSASFTAAGQGRLLSDDGVLVRLAGKGPPKIHGAYSRARLRPDSFVALAEGNGRIQAGQQIGGKQILGGPGEPHTPSEPAALSAFFLLQTEPSQGRDIQLEPLSGPASVIALIQNGFLLDPGDHRVLKEQFEAASALIRTGCPFYSLRYPRRFSDLPAVRARILSVLAD